MSIQSGPQAAGAGAAVALVATLISVYIVSQFLRNSIGVIAPNLALELGLSPAEIGLLSSVFFFVFAAVQIPMGWRSTVSAPGFVSWSARRSRWSVPPYSPLPKIRAS